MSSKFQYFSDIHLESYTFPHQSYIHIKACAPYLIIAGDLGNVFGQWYKKFLSEVSPMFKYVFLTSGNHEYYYDIGKYISDTDQWMCYIDQEIQKVTAQFNNVFYLQNKAFLIPETNLAVYGTTMWSQISDDERCDVRREINDYHKIPRFCTGKSCELFEKNLEHLSNALKTHQDHKFVVFSHYLPSYELISPKYLGCGVNSAYASQVGLAKNPQIVAWVAGHTHTPIRKGKFYVNPIGYFGENKDTDFNKTFTV